MGYLPSSETRIVNIAHYNAQTGEFNIYKDVRVIFRYHEMHFIDPKTNKKKYFNVYGVKDGEMGFYKQSAIIWTTNDIDPYINVFKQAVWEKQLERYGHMVADALSLIRKQKATLEKARAVLVD